MSNHDRHGMPPPNGDAAVQRAWREASDDQPPAHLDAAIIAASRKAIADRGEPKNTATGRAPSRHWLTRWQPLAAAATVAGLAFVLVQMLPRDVTDDRQAPSVNQTVVPDDRVVVPEQAPAHLSVPARQPAAPAPLRAPPARSAEAAVRDSAGPVAVSGEAGADRRQAEAPETAGSAAKAPAAASLPPARERDLGKAVAPDADAWTARIVALHAAGEVAAAADALRAFRAADPDADTYLPDSLRDWAGTVQ